MPRGEHSDDLVTNQLWPVSILDREVPSQKIAEREEWRRRSVRHPSAAEYTPSLRRVAARELIHETRLADSRLSDDPDHLSLTAPRGRHPLGHEPQLGIAADEPVEWATTQSESGALTSRQPPEWDGAHMARRRGRELEPALQKRYAHLAHDDGVELIESRERVESRPRRALALQIDGPAALMVTDEDRRDMQHDLHVLAGALVRLRDRQCRAGGADGGVFNRFQAEGGHEGAAAELDDRASERFDFPHHVVGGPTCIIGEVHTEQRHAALFPGRPRDGHARGGLRATPSHGAAPRP